MSKLIKHNACLCLYGFLFLILSLMLTKHLKSESRNIEEEEVLKLIRECLDLREKYVFREKVVPWMNGAVQESAISDVKQNPFNFVPVEATAVSYIALPVFYHDRMILLYASGFKRCKAFVFGFVTFLMFCFDLRVAPIQNGRWCSACLRQWKW